MQKINSSTKLIMFPTTILDLIIFVDMTNIILSIWSKLSEDQKKTLAGGWHVL